MKKYLIPFIAGIALLTTCAKDVYSPDACFQEDVLPIFVSNCTQSECHNSQEHEAGYDLSNYEGIMKGIKAKHPLQSEIYNTIRGNNPSMPRGSAKLTTKQVNTIKTWINMGAPNNSNCRTCDTAQFTFSGRVKPIMDSWCIGCHSSTNSSGGFDLSTYNGVVGAIPNNKLVGSLKHLSGFSAMPKNAGSLSQCDIAAIEKWVLAGYQNN